MWLMRVNDPSEHEKHNITSIWDSNCGCNENLNTQGAQDQHWELLAYPRANMSARYSAPELLEDGASLL